MNIYSKKLEAYKEQLKEMSFKIHNNLESMKYYGLDESETYATMEKLGEDVEKALYNQSISTAY